jgi:hypothetical protein
LSVGVPVTSLWKIVKRFRLLLRGACEVIVEISMFGMEENLYIRKGPLFFVEIGWRRR